MSGGPFSVSATDARWWSSDFKSERHRKILEVVRAIRSNQEHWQKRDVLHAHLYGNLPMLGFGPNSYAKLEPDDGRLVMNIVKPKVDTWVSLICRSKPEPMFLPTGATAAEEMWTLRRRCREMERFCRGKLEECRFHDEIAPLAVLDVGIFDYGLAKVCICGVDDAKQNWQEAEVDIQRVYPHQMVIDDAEAMNGSPRSIFQRQWVDRFVLIARFPNKKQDILACPKKTDPGEWNYDDTSDMILVTESWHLPSGKEETDGRRCLVIDNATLLDEQYDEDRFPFAFLRQTPAPWGIRGLSIAHQLRPIQLAISMGMLDMQDAVALMARPKWLLPRQGGINKAHIDDDIGTAIEYDAPYKPEAYTPPAIGGDQYKWYWDLWDRADEVIGIAKSHSAGIVPSNLKSGKAQEVANDTQDGRFLISSRLFEAWCMEVVELVIDKARIIAKHKKNYASRYIDGKQVQFIDFSEVDMRRDEYTLQCYPASALANTPGARYDQLEEMRQNGVIDLPTFRHLLDFPDIEGAMKQLNAPHDLAEKLIERYLTADDPEDPDVYLAPEPSWPIQTLYEKFLYAAVDAQTDGAPDANVNLLRRFMQQLEAQAAKIGLQLPGMPPPGQGPANTAAPLGVPGGAPPPMMPPGALPGAPVPGGPPGVPGALPTGALPMNGAPPMPPG